MIGLSSFLIELAFVIFPLAVFALTGHSIWFKREPNTQNHFLMVLTGAMLLMTGTRYASEVGHHVFLSRLSGDQVSRIQVGQAEISNEADIARVVTALNERRWFSSNHGGWAQPVDLVITMKSGAAYRYHVAHYQRQEGAIIEFTRPWRFGTWHDGYVFCERLPSVLDQIGINLPSKP